MDGALANIRLSLIGFFSMLLAVTFTTQQASANTPIVVSPEKSPEKSPQKSIERIEASVVRIKIESAGPIRNIVEDNGRGIARNDIERLQQPCGDHLGRSPAQLQK